MAEQKGFPRAKSGTPSNINLELFRTTPVQVQSTHTAELVIGLCGPIGSPLHKVAEVLGKLLKEQFGYTACNIIRLSAVIEEFAGKVESGSRFERIQSLIEKGNNLRSKHGNRILADLAISKIAAHRESDRQKTGSEKFEPRRICHIVDSVKNQEELEALRLVYRNMFYFVGAFSPMPYREKHLEHEQGMVLSEVYQTIDRDSGEEFSHGQTVRDTFPHADFFLRINSDTERPMTEKLERFLDIVFGTEVKTPTPAETAMYMAASAAGNSGCLSRQVGAALTDSHGEILAVGWNDVPKAKGGVYQMDGGDLSGKNDERCLHRGGYCSNDKEKDLLAERIAMSLVQEGVIPRDKFDSAVKAVRSSKIKSLIEFSRSVHAEMHALILGSQLAGERVRGGKLYCTTYPCHSCARHIILAGIKDVYYIEPYRKSLATKLHDDAITEVETDDNKVRILPFDGVAPERYLELFRVKPDSRKDKTGKKSLPTRKEAIPKSEVTLESLPALEGLVVQRLISNKVISVDSQDELETGGDHGK